MGEEVEAVRAKPEDAGCWIDGHWGHYGSARLVNIACSYETFEVPSILVAGSHEPGAGTYLPADEVSTLMLDYIGSRTGPTWLDDFEVHEQIQWASEAAEEFLNEHVAPEGFYFGWHDGEFFLAPMCSDEETCTDETCWHWT